MGSWRAPGAAQCVEDFGAPHVWLEAPGRRPVGASVAVEQRGSGRTDRSTGASRVDRFERLVTLCGPASGPRPRCRGPRS